MRDTTIELIMREVAPCDICEHANKCGAELMACRVFAYYTRTGYFNSESPRDPSYTLYNKLFSEDEKELIRVLKELSKKEVKNDE
jgi:hypothetical protein